VWKGDTVFENIQDVDYKMCLAKRKLPKFDLNLDDLEKVGLANFPEDDTKESVPKKELI